MTNRLNERQWGIISTVVFHVLIFLFFIAVQVAPQEEPEEFVELTLASTTLRRAERYSPPQPQPASPPPAQTQQAIRSQPRDVVKMPEREMTEKAPPEIKEAPRERVFMEENPARLSEDRVRTTEPPREESQVDLRDRYIGRREDAPAPNQVTGARTGPSPETSEVGEGLSPAQSFSIEWVGGNREKLWGDLPSYPKGLNKAATIRVRFFVNPDGTVGQTIILQKGDPRLESITTQALKTWRFNRLEDNAPQVQQQGIATFIFRVE